MEMFVKSFRMPCGFWLIHEQTVKKCLILNWNKTVFKFLFKYFAKTQEITSEQLFYQIRVSFSIACIPIKTNLQLSITPVRGFYINSCQNPPCNCVHPSGALSPYDFHSSRTFSLNENEMLSAGPWWGVNTLGKLHSSLQPSCSLSHF